MVLLLFNVYKSFLEQFAIKLSYYNVIAASCAIQISSSCLRFFVLF